MVKPIIMHLDQSATPSEGAKRRYKAHFISKLTDCDGENSEADTSLDFAFDCGYISKEEHTNLTEKNHEIGKMLGAMLNSPTQWLLTLET